MRVPFLRSDSEDPAYAWWEWLLAPVVIPLVLVLLAVAAIAAVPVEFLLRIYLRRAERKFAARLASAGRVMAWSEVEARLLSGEGTLIVEHTSPKGPVREWWTPNGLVGSAPVPLPTSVTSVIRDVDAGPLAEYARSCVTLYTDDRTGAAMLTRVPAPLSRRVDPRKYVVVELGGGCISAIFLPTGRGLAGRYPGGRVVTLLTWSDHPFVAAGDAETVFQSG
jgi:hypothetical protein